MSTKDSNIKKAIVGNRVASILGLRPTYYIFDKLETRATIIFILFYFFVGFINVEVISHSHGGYWLGKKYSQKACWGRKIDPTLLRNTCVVGPCSSKFKAVLLRIIASDT